MKNRTSRALTLALCLLPFGTTLAQDGPPPRQPIDAKARHAVIQGLGEKLQANYVFPDVAQSLAAQLAAKEASGGYAKATDTAAFADALSNDLRTLGKDGHFTVEFAPGLEPAPGATIAPKVPSAEEIAQGRIQAGQLADVVVPDRDFFACPERASSASNACAATSPTSRSAASVPPNWSATRTPPPSRCPRAARP